MAHLGWRVGEGLPEMLEAEQPVRAWLLRLEDEGDVAFGLLRGRAAHAVETAQLLREMTRAEWVALECIADDEFARLTALGRPLVPTDVGGGEFGGHRV